MEILAAVGEKCQRRIKTYRSSVLLENEELEQDFGRGDKRDLCQLLQAARKENDTLEEKLAGLQEQLSRSQAEVRHLKAELANVTKKSKTEIEDLKTEALTARAQLILDNKAQKDTIRILEEWIDKLTEQQQQQNEARQSVLGTVNQEMASRHQLATFSRQDSGLSVKSLIQSIEKNKQTEKPILSTINQEMASRHKLATCSRQDSGLSVKSSIKGIKNNEQTEKPILSTINQEEASTHKLATFSRQDSGLSQMFYNLSELLPIMTIARSSRLALINNTENGQIKFLSSNIGATLQVSKYLELGRLHVIAIEKILYLIKGKHQASINN
ncbi:hypothetical protein GQX74_003702 [Glossina fuscipes]|nr:hypothetical protein GQX74_003702 [Glossina fuscipes]